MPPKEDAHVAPLPCDVGLALGLPEIRVCFWDCFPTLTPMHMPETTMNEDDRPIPWEHNIGSPREIAAM